MRKLTMIVVHCTASRCTSTLTPAALEAEHKKRFSRGCGYHYYITRDGEIHTMRDITIPGAHAKGFNAYSVGIAYEGGLDEQGIPADTRTPAQKESLLVLIRRLMAEYPDICVVVGHRDLSPDLNGNGIIEKFEWIKICPCFDASAEYFDLIRGGALIND